jgi:hypothetical protein
MSNWMKCNSCGTLVHINATGICTGCQMGFMKPPKEERYLSTETKEERAEEPIDNQGIIPAKEEREKERLKQQEK